jgi:hypothetical protein
MQSTNEVLSSTEPQKIFDPHEIEMSIFGFFSLLQINSIFWHVHHTWLTCIGMQARLREKEAEVEELRELEAQTRSVKPYPTI